MRTRLYCMITLAVKGSLRLATPALDRVAACGCPTVSKLSTIKCAVDGENYNITEYFRPSF
jgi:hypothetical protein